MINNDKSSDTAADQQVTLQELYDTYVDPASGITYDDFVAIFADLCRRLHHEH